MRAVQQVGALSGPKGMMLKVKSRLLEPAKQSLWQLLWWTAIWWKLDLASMLIQQSRPAPGTKLLIASLQQGIGKL